ncbi:hypothetical protein DTO195F2_3982 [Paecilomyces variotii]|nr:hypothetical protein DTO195F2_3982 [Paecilomyces variotii]KAJ9400453.1 hypothetical protein DTO282F9_2640 [Paecilomyces variotii]
MFMTQIVFGIAPTLLKTFSHLTALDLWRPSAPYVFDPVTSSTYLGTIADGVEEFLGIFYGQDTGGSNRFAPPKPYIPSRHSFINASTAGAACPQPYVPLPADPYTVLTNVSEDCLSLRVARPENTKSTAKLPVMVWLYGGGASVGTAYDVSYNPVGLIQQSVVNGSPVIYVAINYRVNLFGHAFSDALLKSKSTNLAMQDQRLGIEWIKNHISAFGGDPDNITLFGEDEGATYIALHILSNREVPFHRAILQSGAAITHHDVNGNRSARNFAAVAARCNCLSDGNRDVDSQDTVDCLRQVPMEDLVNATFKVAHSVDPVNGFRAFMPAVDGYMIPDEPSNLLSRGQVPANISILAGWTRDESSMSVPTSIRTAADAASFISTQFPLLNASTIHHFLTFLYPESDFTTNSPSSAEKVTPAWRATSALHRDLTLTCPTIFQAWSLRLSSNCTTPVYLYELRQSPFATALNNSGVGYLGIVHFSDVPYVFNELERTYYITDPEENKLAQRISASWTAFASGAFPLCERSERSLGRWEEAYGGDRVCRDRMPEHVRVKGIGDNGDQDDGDEIGKLMARCGFINRLEY